MWMKYFMAYGNLLVAAGSLGIGGLVISKNWRNRVNRAFFCFTLAVGLYALFYFPMILASDFKSYNIWFYLMAAPVPFIAVGNVYFVFEWLGIARKHRYFIMGAYAFAFIMVPLLFTKWFMNGYVETFWGYSYKGGPIYIYGYMLSYIVLWNVAFFTLIRHLPQLYGIRRKQAQLFLIGNIIGAISGLPNFLSLGGLVPQMPPVSSPFVLFYVIFNGYAIVRYHLMDIDTVIHRTLLWLISIFLLVLPAGVFMFLFGKFAGDLSPVYTVILTCVILVVFSRYYTRLKPRVDHVFRRRKYDYYQILADFSQSIGSELDLNVIIERLMEALKQVFYIRNGFILIKYPGQEDYREAGSRGYEEFRTTQISDKIVLRSGSVLVEWIDNFRNALEKGQLEFNIHYALIKDQALSWFRAHEIEVLVPIVAENRTVALVGIGKKESLQAYTFRDVELLEKMGRQIGITIDNALHHEDIVEKERLSQELRVGKNIQTSLLPQSTPSVEGLLVQGVMCPAKEIGGDYYDFIVRKGEEGTLGIVIGDVSGKGVGAGLIMAMAKTAIYAACHEDVSPREILLKTHWILHENIHQQAFMTMLFLRWDAQKKTLRYSSAGHEHIIVYRKEKEAEGKNKVELIKSGGVMLGIVPQIEEFLEDRDLVLNPGDKVVLYTDGATEARNTREDMFGLKRLVDIVSRQGEKPIDELITVIRDEIYGFMEGREQYDDITLVGMEAK